VLSRFLKIAALVLTFVIIAGASAYFTLTLIIRSEDAVVIPELVGKDVVYALELLSDLGLNTKVKGTEYSQNMPKNFIIFQEPEPGTEIKKGRDVKIVISKGPQSILLPKLVGLSLQQARIILEENELCSGNLAYVESDRWEKDQVMAQVPEPGVQTLRDSCVDLLVSLGVLPASYLMPELLGLPLDDVMLVLERLNLTPGQIRSAFDKTRPLDTVIGQHPAGGYRVTAGTHIDLTLNRIPLNDSGADDRESMGLHLFRYRIDPGLLKQQVHVRVSRLGQTLDLFDDFAKPGEEIWLLVPKGRRSTLVLYLDNQPVKTELID
jgi:eukaryotic-like serine/threonine-protein kinase